MAKDMIFGHAELSEPSRMRAAKSVFPYNLYLVSLLAARGFTWAGEKSSNKSLYDMMTLTFKK